jgi:hypothetical protein
MPRRQHRTSTCLEPLESRRYLDLQRSYFLLIFLGTEAFKGFKKTLRGFGGTRGLGPDSIPRANQDSDTVAGFSIREDGILTSALTE